MRVALVSCVKSKLRYAAPARELYTSPLFTGLRAVAESTAQQWFILSARYGVVEPTAVLEPYELTLNRMTKRQREGWSDRAYAQLLERLPVDPDCTVVVYAGARYREFLVPRLEAGGYLVEIPLEGMGMGRQLQWLAARRGQQWLAAHREQLARVR